MKVVQVCPLYHPNKGGVEIRVKETSERMARLGMDVDVLCLDPSKKLPRQEVINGVNVKRFHTWTIAGIQYSPGLKRYLKENAHHYDIIHAHNFHSLPAYYAVQARNGCCLVLTPSYHGKSGGPKRRILLAVFQTMWKRFLGGVDKFACVSEAEWHLMCKELALPAEKGVIISNAASLEEIAAARPYVLDFKLILYLGRLEKYKNVDHIIEAMPYIDRQYRLYILGDGSYKASLQALITRLNLDDRVVIMSSVSDELAHRWYQTCSVFVTLSSLESFGRTVIEALSAGKPVVASDIPPFLELAAKLKGIKVVRIPGVTPRELANTIVESAASSPLNNDLGAYSWNTITDRIKQVYNDVLAAKR